MRRALCKQWPALSHLYGLHPWHAGGDPVLTFNELDSYAADLAARAKQNRDAARPSRKRR